MSRDITKKPNPDFVVRLVGAGIKPWLVPMRNLARVLDAVQRLVEQKEDDDDEDIEGVEPVLQEDRVLRLIGLKSGSAAYAVASHNSANALAMIAETGKAIKKPDAADWPPATLSALKSLSEQAKSLDCNIEIRLPGQRSQYGDVLAIIQPITFDQVASSAFVTGSTSVFAKVERVGGATEMHCGIRLPDHPRKMVICRVVSEQLVRELGQFMYDHIVVSGKATWIKHNWQLKHLVITSFEPPKTGSIQEALDEIYNAGGKAWDKVKDPDAALKELRQ